MVQNAQMAEAYLNVTPPENYSGTVARFLMDHLLLLEERKRVELKCEEVEGA